MQTRVLASAAIAMIVAACTSSDDRAESTRPDDPTRQGATEQTRDAPTLCDPDTAAATPEHVQAAREVTAMPFDGDRNLALHDLLSEFGAWETHLVSQDGTISARTNDAAAAAAATGLFEEAFPDRLTLCAQQNSSWLVSSAP